MNGLLLSVLSNLCVAGMIAVVAWFVGRSGRRAATAHLLWVAVFVKLITPPIFVAPVQIPASWIGLAHSSINNAEPVAEASTDVSAQAPAATGDVPSDAGELTASVLMPSGSQSLQDFGLLHALLLVWAVGTAFLLIRGAIRFIGFLRLIRHEGALDRRAMVTARRLLRQSSKYPAEKKCPTPFAGNRPSGCFAQKGSDTFFPGRLRVPPVYRIAIRVSPMLFGLGRWTAVICPEQLWKSLPLDGRRAFLAHELAHYRRGDHWVRWIEWLVTSVYWWLPAVYAARRRLELHEEVACDAWALAHLRTPPRKYAETLLNVVDFLSETPTASPRLASRMHAADSLEERLRWIMSPQPPAPPARFSSLLLVAVIALLLVVHPRPRAADASASLAVPEIAGSVEAVVAPQAGESSPLGGPAVGGRKGDAVSADDPLPPTPQGWWTEQPDTTWAAHVLGEDLLIRGSAGRGIAIGRGERLFHFEPDELRAAAFVPATGRLFLGNRGGEIHLWDADALRSVSLIGRHPGPVTSLAFHPEGGLVSGDRDGNLIAWNPRAGEIVAVVSLGDSISSVRWSADGDRLAVSTGGWADGETQQVHFLIGRGLQSEISFALPPATALVQAWTRPMHSAEADPQPIWVSIDWAGEVRSLVTGTLVAVIPKTEVSAAVLCQDFLSDGLTPRSSLGHD